MLKIGIGWTHSAIKGPTQIVPVVANAPGISGWGLAALAAAMLVVMVLVLRRRVRQQTGR